MNIEDLRQRMGAEASTEEAERMADLLKTRHITEIEQVDEMDSKEFFALIPSTIETKSHE